MKKSTALAHFKKKRELGRSLSANLSGATPTLCANKMRASADSHYHRRSKLGSPRAADSRNRGSRRPQPRAQRTARPIRTTTTFRLAVSEGLSRSRSTDCGTPTLRTFLRAVSPSMWCQPGQGIQNQPLHSTPTRIFWVGKTIKRQTAPTKLSSGCSVPIRCQSTNLTLSFSQKLPWRVIWSTSWRS